ncbi:hypothetical protein B7463_g12372, partial [Scytalidium lignicola]
MTAPSRGSRAAASMLRSTRHQRVCSECVKTISRSTPIPQRTYATAATTKSSSSTTAAGPPPPSSSLNIPITPCPSNTPEYAVKASVVLSRPPLITAPQSSFDSAFFFYQKRLNERLAMPFTRYFYFKKDTPADHDWKIKAADRNGAAARELGGYQAYGKMGWNDEILVGDERSKPGYVVQKLLEEAKVRAVEGKDGAVSIVGADAVAADEESGLDRVESRWTEADRTRDVRRLDRKLAETLYLVVQREKGGWGFPTGDLIGRENLHQAAERILVQSAGVNMNTWIVGHAPIGHHFIKPYVNPDTKAIERVGDKIFFMKGRIMAGQADLKGNLFGLADFKWLTKRELENAQLSAMPQIVILGAGVTGLQTALTLLHTPSISSKYSITVLAAHLPGDNSSADYTSPAAGGHWRPHSSSSPSDAEQREWDARTYNVWRELLASKEKEGLSKEEIEKKVGLGIRESRNYWGMESSETEGGDGRGLWWRETVEGLEVLRGKNQSGEVVNYGDDGVIRTTVDMSTGLSGVVDDVKKKISEFKKGEEIVALVNATGLVARHFVEKDEAAKLYPVRGQTVVVRGEAKMGRTFSAYDGPDSIAYVLPRVGSGTTVLGGSKQVGNWDVNEDKELTVKILEVIKREGLAEELRTDTKNGEKGFEIIKVGAGLRPARKGGPRVEVERNKSGKGGKKINDVWVVHAYGHAGGGYQNSIGSAEKVTRLIGELLGSKARFRSMI